MSTDAMPHRVRIFMRGSHELVHNRELQSGFIGALADVAECPPGAIEAPSFRDGCVVFQAFMTEDGARVLNAKYSSLNQASSASKKAHFSRFVETYSVTGIDIDKWWRLAERRRNTVIFAESEFRDLVERVAARFSRSTKMTVTDRAIDALVQPGLGHLEAVQVELNSGAITIETLESAVREILQNAVRWGLAAEAGDSRTINERVVARSMKKHCPYLFWC